MIKRTSVDFANADERQKWLRGLQARAANRARRAGMEFTLPDNHAVYLYDRQKGRCIVSGVEFSLERFPKALVKHPFAPSIERNLTYQTAITLRIMSGLSVSQ